MARLSPKDYTYILLSVLEQNILSGILTGISLNIIMLYIVICKKFDPEPVHFLSFITLISWPPN